MSGSGEEKVSFYAPWEYVNRLTNPGKWETRRRIYNNNVVGPNDLMEGVSITQQKVLEVSNNEPNLLVLHAVTLVPKAGEDNPAAPQSDYFMGVNVTGYDGKVSAFARHHMSGQVLGTLRIAPNKELLTELQLVALPAMGVREYTWHLDYKGKTNSTSLRYKNGKVGLSFMQNIFHETYSTNVRRFFATISAGGEIDYNVNERKSNASWGARLAFGDQTFPTEVTVEFNLKDTGGSNEKDTRLTVVVPISEQINCLAELGYNITNREAKGKYGLCYSLLNGHRLKLTADSTRRIMAVYEAKVTHRVGATFSMDAHPEKSDFKMGFGLQLN